MESASGRRQAQASDREIVGSRFAAREHTAQSSCYVTVREMLWRRRWGLTVIVAGALLCATFARAQSSTEFSPLSARTANGPVRYQLDAVRIEGNERTSAKVVRRYIPFAAGDILDVDDPRLRLVRFRLLGTGFFKDAELRLERSDQHGHVILVISLEERNTLALNDVWMGLAASADTDGSAQPISPFAGVDVAARNLFGSGVTLTGGGAFSQDQLALNLRFLDPSLGDSRWMVSADVLFNQALGFFGNSEVQWENPNQIARVTRQAVLEVQRLQGTFGLGTDLNVSTQLWLHYRLESALNRLPRAAAHRFGGELEPIDFHVLPGRTVLSSLAVSLQHDTRDEPVLPQSGWLARASLEASLLPLGSDYTFQRLDGSLTRWLHLGNGRVLALDGRIGLIAGDAPFYDRYYIGDLSDFRPARVLGLAFDDRPAPNLLGNAISEVRYGDYFAKVNATYRIPLYRGSRSVFGIDFFASFGVYSLLGERDISSPPRDRSGASRVALDLTANAGFVFDTSLGGFAVSFANAIGFLRFHSGDASD